MAEPESKDTDMTRMVDIFADFRYGRMNRQEAIDKLCREAGMIPSVADAFIRSMSRQNIVELRGHRKPRGQKRGWKVDKMLAEREKNKE